MDLFVHRPDVFAEQQPNGAYFPVTRPLTDMDVEEHLAGMASYGTYVINPDGQTVKYIVWDLDILDEDAADTLCEVVERMVRVVSTWPWSDGLLREFSGNKGTHVWLFLAEPVPAEKVRRWVAADFTPKWTEVAAEKGWPGAIEVFPKQDAVLPGGYGNLVKLPLGVHRVSGARSEIVPCQDWPNSVDEVVPLPVHLVPDRERLLPSPTRRERGRAGGVSTAGPASPFPCVDHIMREGVGSGYRDRAMFHLALYCYGHGLDEDLASEVCNRANENFDPPLEPSEVDSKVRSAYRGTYESATCGSDWLAEICPGPCRTGLHVRHVPAGGELRKAVVGDSLNVEVVRTQADEGRKRITVRHPDADNTPTFITSRST
jgi:hypothetical protein